MPTYPQTFPAEQPIAVSITTRAGSVSVSAADVPEVTANLQPTGLRNSASREVIENTLLDFHDGVLRIEVPQKAMRWTSLQLTDPGVDIAVTVPRQSTASIKAGSADVRAANGLADVTIEAGSGDVTVDGCADVSVRTGSGDIHLQNVAAAKAHTGSGDVLVESCADGMTITSGSGDVEIAQVLGHSEIQTASGDIEVGTIEAAARLKTASGDVEIQRAMDGEMQVTTASGDIEVGVTAGTAAKLDCSSVSGRVHSDLDPADAPAESERAVILTARAMSGSISITRSQ